MTPAAAALALRCVLFATAAIACAAAGGAQAPIRAPSDAAVPDAASLPAPQAAPPKPHHAGDYAPVDAATHRRLMLLMLMDRVREIGPFGRLGQ
jgi:hypothetical protein